MIEFHNLDMSLMLEFQYLDVTLMIEFQKHLFSINQVNNECSEVWQTVLEKSDKL